MKTEKLCMFVSVLMAAVWIPRWTEAQDRMLGLIEREISTIARQVESGIVSVYADIPLARQKEGWRRNVGSGVVLDSTGYVITVEHVIHGAERIEVAFPHGRQYVSRIVGCDLGTGVAVLHVQGEKMDRPPFGDSDRIQGGEGVFVIGNTMGIVSPSAFGFINGFRPERELLQLSVRLSPGNTGAPVFDRQGRVLGIVVGELSNRPNAPSDIDSLNSRESGVSLAVPINTVWQIAQELIAQDHAQCGWLGIEGIVVQFDSLSIGTKGILVWNVVQNSPAEKADLHKDDVIVEYNGHPIEEAEELSSQVRQTPQGTKVHLKIKRGDQYQLVTVQVGKKPTGSRTQ